MYMPATSNILPDREEDSEGAEREIMMPAAEVIDGVIGEEWFVDIFIIRDEGQPFMDSPLVSVPCHDRDETIDFVENIFTRNYVMIDHDVYPLHRISHFHVRSEAIKIRTIES